MIHLAALPSVPRSVQDSPTTDEVNVTGTQSVVLAARDAGGEEGGVRVVFVRVRHRGCGVGTVCDEIARVVSAPSIASALCCSQGSG